MADTAPRPTLQHDVFISYAAADRPWANRLAHDLIAAGFDVFWDEQLWAGVEWAPSLRRALDASRHLIVLWSGHARSSDFVQQELAVFAGHVAEDSQRRLIQINLESENRAYSRFFAMNLLREARVYPGDPSAVEPALWSDLITRVVQALGGERRPVTPSDGLTLNAEDFAIVIGISRYPALTDVPHAAGNARAVADWLIDHDGGRLPRDNVTVVSEAVTRPDGSRPDSSRPTRTDIDVAFALLNDRVRLLGDAPLRRLYVYMSGHGVVHPGGHLTLLLTNASVGTRETGDDSVGITTFVESPIAERFEEIVLFVDCDWFSSSGSGSPSLNPASPEANRNFFYCLASDVGQDDAVPSTGMRSPGSLTEMLLDGLRGGAVTADGTITSLTLWEYLSKRWSAISPRGHVVVARGGRAIVFGRPRASSAADEPPGEPERVTPAQERMAAHPDDPALVDQLGRRPFAEVLAARIEEVWEVNRPAVAAEGTDTRPRTDDRAFMINLHGPWGAGKTSVLNFLRANLSDSKRPESRRWVVVDFNAWRHQRLQPPWWNLIREVQTQAVAQVGWSRGLALRTRWLLWRIRADWLPIVVAVALIGLAGVLASIRLLPQPVSTKAPDPDATAKAVELSLKIVAGVLALGAALVTLSRSLAFGSARAAQAYMEARSDPLGPIVALFKSLVESLGRPLIIFVDDLDRCDVSYVVALLEGIQTLFRRSAVTYVVAADRKWICSCFEKTYADFAGPIGEPGRPLGYLFLDKVFQVSASVPRLSPEIQGSYWKALLGGGSIDPVALENAQKAAEDHAVEAVKDLHTQEQLQAKIAEVREDPVREQAMRAAAAKQITSTEAQQRTEHRLQPFADLLEPNPRSMKRLVNAYGLHQATHFLEGRRVSPEALARWTIIELRWPLLADFLAGRPERVTDAANGVPPTDDTVPGNLRPLFGAGEVSAVLANMDEPSIQSIVGLAGPVAGTSTRKATGTGAVGEC